MQVEQAIFTSIDNGSMKGYQLTSRSSRIDKHIAQELCRWAPSHASLLAAESDYSSLNYFPVLSNWVAIARTFYGGPEYSGRGSMQIVTHFLVLRLEQFADYDYDPLAVARTAQALGYLRLTSEMPEQLPKARLTDKPLLYLPAPMRCESAEDESIDEQEIYAEVLALVKEGQRVAAVGIASPMNVCERLIGQLPAASRLQMSIATGLKPSTHRKFQLHFIPHREFGMEKRLMAQGITCVSSNRSVADDGEVTCLAQRPV